MSEIKVNKISPRAACGTVQLGDSGDTFTIPAGATINNQGTATNFGATGAVSWSTTIKTSGFTAVAGEGYFVDTTSGPITVNLPAGTAGAVVGVKDYANTFDSNSCTLNLNGSDKVGGLSDNVILSTEGIAITLVFIDSTKGWLVTDSGLQSEATTAAYVTATGGNTTTTVGDFKVHAFTSPGTFCVSDAGNPGGSNTMEVMLVAGGGGGGGNEGGGGGAGGLILQPSFSVAASPYPISIGAGGNGGVHPGITSGANTTGFSFTAVGGGNGGFGSGTPNGPGAPWGVSSGGSGGGGQVNAGAGAASTQGPSMPAPLAPLGFGFAGGSGNPSTPGGGGGGGAGEAGNTDGQAAGGDGKDVSPTFGTAPQPFYLANNPNNGPTAGGIFAGGGAGAYNLSEGGDGGGGHGAPPSNGPNPAKAGLTNSGGGGGGGPTSGGLGGNGGSGIVLIRYKFQN